MKTFLFYGPYKMKNEVYVWVDVDLAQRETFMRRREAPGRNKR